MPKRSFGRWLRALYDSLEVGGHLMFTTHGLKSCEQLGITHRDIPADGFYFSAQSEQHDLDQAEYGSTLCTPYFVIGQIKPPVRCLDRALQTSVLVGAPGSVRRETRAVI